MSEPVPRLPVQLVQHVAGHRHVTTFEPDKAIAAMKVRGFELVRWRNGDPEFRGVKPLGVQRALVFEEPAGT